MTENTPAPAADAPDAPVTRNVVTLPLDSIKPYWRNPRDISEEAVNKTAASIARFGYQQPIIVDAKHVIIAGHTRYAALRHLGWTEAPVIVSDLPAKRANEYRVIDNKTSEYSAWDSDLLMQELREFDEVTLEEYFPGIDLGLEFNDLDLVTDDDALKAELKVNQDLGTAPEASVTITCTNCFEDVEIPAERFFRIADELRE